MRSHIVMLKRFGAPTLYCCQCLLECAFSRRVCRCRADVASNGAGAITSYLWFFGDNTTSTQQAPLHLYSFEKKFSLHSRLISLIFGFHGINGIYGVELIYIFSDEEFRNYENELSKDLEEFLQICSDSHLEDETEISYSPVYKHCRSFYNPQIRIEFRDRNDIKELKKFSTLVIQMLTSHEVFDKIEIKKIDVWDKVILIEFGILIENGPK